MKVSDSERMRYFMRVLPQAKSRAGGNLVISFRLFSLPPALYAGCKYLAQMSGAGSSFSCDSSILFQSSRRLAIFFPPRVRRVSRPSSLFALNAAHHRSAASFNSSIDCTGSSFSKHSNCVSTMSFAFSTCPLARGLPGMCGFVSTRSAVSAAVTGLETFAEPQSHCGLHK